MNNYNFYIESAIEKLGEEYVKQNNDILKDFIDDYIWNIQIKEKKNRVIYTIGCFEPQRMSYDFDILNDVDTEMPLYVNKRT